MKHIKQEFSLKARVRCPGWTDGLGQPPKINVFINDHVAYQIRGNEAYNNMLTKNALTLSIPWVGSKSHSFLWKQSCCISN